MTDRRMIRSLAILVMGWPVVTSFADLGDHIVRDQGCFAEIPEPGFSGEVQDFNAVTPMGYPWNPLEKIEHAWMVRDRLAEWGSVGIFRDPEGNERVTFTPRPDCGSAMFAESYTPGISAARALCRCALSAVGLDLEKGDPHD